MNEIVHPGGAGREPAYVAAMVMAPGRPRRWSDPRLAGPGAAWEFDAADPASAARCRHATRAILVAWRLDKRGTLVDDALVIVSELVGNVHLHVGHSTGTIALAWAERTLSIQVGDRSPARPSVPSPGPRANGWDWHGWGLVVVERIAAGYGGEVNVLVDPAERGKSVCVELPVKTIDY
jgi:hypothetical protein